MNVNGFTGSRLPLWLAAAGVLALAAGPASAEHRRGGCGECRATSPCGSDAARILAVHRGYDRVVIVGPRRWDRLVIIGGRGFHRPRRRWAGRYGGWPACRRRRRARGYHFGGPSRRWPAGRGPGLSFTIRF